MKSAFPKLVLASIACLASLVSSAAVRVGLFAGDGACGVAAAEWARIIHDSPELELALLDGGDIRSGSLSGCDLVVFPPGDGKRQYAELGEAGAEALRSYLASGGRVYASGDGVTALASNGDGTGARILAFSRVGSADVAASLGMHLDVDWRSKFGVTLRSSYQHVQATYDRGPLFEETEPLGEGVTNRVIARYNCEECAVGQRVTSKDAPYMYLKPAIILGYYGDGRVFATSQSFEKTRTEQATYVAVAIEWLVGTKPTFPARPHSLRSLAVGYFADAFAGKADIEAFLDLCDNEDFDVYAIDAFGIYERDLARIDALVVPGTAASGALTSCAPVKALCDSFVGSGRRLYTWGAGAAGLAPFENVVTLGSPSSLASALASAPAVTSAPAAKVASPVRVAFLTDKGPGGSNAMLLEQMAVDAPELDVFGVTGSDIQGGCLTNENYDILIVAGGDSSQESTSLGEVGRQAVRKFVKSGGAYLGSCAGCRLALNEGSAYLKLVPYTRVERSSTSSRFAIRFNAEGAAALGLDEGFDYLSWYHGGPFMTNTAAVANSSCTRWGWFNGESCHSVSNGYNKLNVMYGSTAVVGGEYGSGRVFVSAAHSENDYGSHAIHVGALSYLAGRTVTEPPHTRTTRAVSVAVVADELTDPDSVTLFKRLRRDRRFDTFPINGSKIDEGVLDHVDAVVWPNSSIAYSVSTFAKKQIVAFAKAGGKVFYWGSGSGGKSGVSGADFACDSADGLADKLASEYFPESPEDYLDATLTETRTITSKSAVMTGRTEETFTHPMRDEWIEDGYSASSWSGHVNTFYVLHPRDDDSASGRPLYVCLHSAGESGAIAATNGTNSTLYNTPEGFYGLYLDCTAHKNVDWWWGATTKYQAGGTPEEPGTAMTLSPCENRVIACVKWAILKYGIDPNRVYLGGMSMGGSGALGIGLNHGDIFASIRAGVPAGVVHAANRMAFAWKRTESVAPVAAALALPDPPPLMDVSGSNDAAWSKDHDQLYDAMSTRRYAIWGFWGPWGHSSSDSKILPKLDLVGDVAWTNIVLNEAYAVFTRTSSDSAQPAWGSSTAIGQVNGFCRYAVKTDTAAKFEIELKLTDFDSASTANPSAVTADVSIRRLQKFPHAAGQRVTWTCGDESGMAIIDELGVFTIPQLTITRAATTLALAPASSSAGHVVTFIDSNGVTLATRLVADGGAAVAPADPSRSGATFSGWDKPFDNVTADIAVTATYDGKEMHTVTFYAKDKSSVLATRSVGDGEAAVAPTPPAVPGFNFYGWDTDISCVTSDLEVTAVYTEDLWVEFVNWNLDLLKSGWVEKGTAAVPPAETPVHDAGYTFVGWDSDYSCVTTNMTIKAVYETPKTGVFFWNGGESGKWNKIENWAE